MGTRPSVAHRSYRVAPAPAPGGAEGDAAESGAAEASAEPDLGVIRTYRAPRRALSMPNVTSVREQARDREQLSVPVTLVLDDAAVSGTVGVRRRGALRYEVVDEGLACSRDGAGCPHTEEARESARAMLEARRVRTGLEGLARATEASAGPLAADHEASVTAGQAAAAVPGGGSNWEEDHAAFQAAYTAAQERRRRGEAAVPFMTENATGGLGARNGGRSFGVEMEFDIAPGVDRHTALQNIARDLHAEGLTPQPRQTGYHSNAGDYSRWRFETDATVHGEVISPVMYDEPESWHQLSRVCEIVRRHGGVATARTGGHVHVGVGDYDHTVENHARLLGSFKENEDTLYRLAQNPARRRHRGTSWCRPNMAPSGPYANPRGLAVAHSGHGLGLNFGAAYSGQASDHVEFRMWDSSLDPGVIQTQVKVSLGMTRSALASRAEPAGPAEPIGTHRAANAALGRGGRLRGEAWQRDTRGFRALVDRVFSRDEDKAQATALFAVTRWQRAGR
jgi:hypothetical protein